MRHARLPSGERRPKPRRSVGDRAEEEVEPLGIVPLDEPLVVLRHRVADGVPLVGDRVRPLLPSALRPEAGGLLERHGPPPVGRDDARHLPLPHDLRVGFRRRRGRHEQVRHRVLAVLVVLDHVHELAVLRELRRARRGDLGDAAADGLTVADDVREVVVDLGAEARHDVGVDLGCSSGGRLARFLRVLPRGNRVRLRLGRRAGRHPLRVRGDDGLSLGPKPILRPLVDLLHEVLEAGLQPAPRRPVARDLRGEGLLGAGQDVHRDGRRGLLAPPLRHEPLRHVVAETGRGFGRLQALLLSRDYGVGEALPDHARRRVVPIEQLPAGEVHAREQGAVAYRARSLGVLARRPMLRRRAGRVVEHGERPLPLGLCRLLRIGRPPGELPRREEGRVRDALAGRGRVRGDLCNPGRLHAGDVLGDVARRHALPVVVVPPHIVGRDALRRGRRVERAAGCGE